jgi:hypothetical protein
VAAVWESQQEWKEGESELWEDGLGEEIKVEDWWEELGGGQTEPMRSHVREESAGEGTGGVLDLGGVVAGKEDLNSIIGLEQGGLRVEKEESLNVWNLGPHAIAMQKLSRSRSV